MGLIASSARKLADLLQFTRVAFGASASAENFDSRELEKLAQGVFAHVRPSLDWQIESQAMNKPASRAILNIAQIMGAVFLISALLFRSLLAGALVLVPLFAAVLANFGVMGAFGIPLQIATALVSAMAVGIGADYGIYLSYRLREELAVPGAAEDFIPQNQPGPNPPHDAPRKRRSARR